ncbi:MAG: hypothetical protein EXR77_15045 [Myxococcales bacterium]|nr:hypothetical protein [Myxococcales bacterium]
MASFVSLAQSACRLVAVWCAAVGLPVWAAEPTPRSLLDAGDAIQAAAHAERILFGAAGHPPALVEQAAQVWTEAVAATGDYAELASAWQRKQTLMR